MTNYPLFKVLLPMCFGFIGGISVIGGDFVALVVSFLAYCYVVRYLPKKFDSSKNLQIRLQQEFFLKGMIGRLLLIVVRCFEFYAVRSVVLYVACVVYFVAFTVKFFPKDTPASDVSATILVEKTFRKSSYYQTGLCKIVKISALHMKQFEGVHSFLQISKKLDYKSGDLLNIRGVIEPLSPLCADDLSSFSRYLFANKVTHSITRISVAEKIGANRSIVQTARDKFLKLLTCGIEATYADVYQAILFGKKEFLTKEIFDNFFYTGTMHLFAVSGLHVGTVAGFFFFMFKLIRLHEVVNTILTLSFVLFYVIIVGFSASTTRAFIMIFFLLFSKIIYRQPNTASAFLAAMFFTLLTNPWSFFDIGFQLSYGVVAGILWIGMPLSTAATKAIDSIFANRRRRKFLDATVIKCVRVFAVSMGPTLISTILVLYYWKIFSPWSIFVNIMLIPVASIVVIFGINSAIIGLFVTKASLIINSLASLPIKFLISSVDKIFLLPMPYVSITIPNVLLLIAAIGVFKSSVCKN